MHTLQRTLSVVLKPVHNLAHMCIITHIEPHSHIDGSHCKLNDLKCKCRRLFPFCIYHSIYLHITMSNPFIDQWPLTRSTIPSQCPERPQLPPLASPPTSPIPSRREISSEQKDVDQAYQERLIARLLCRLSEYQNTQKPSERTISKVHYDQFVQFCLLLWGTGPIPSDSVAKSVMRGLTQRISQPELREYLTTWRVPRCYDEIRCAIMAHIAPDLMPARGYAPLLSTHIRLIRCFSRYNYEVANRSDAEWAEFLYPIVDKERFIIFFDRFIPISQQRSVLMCMIKTRSGYYRRLFEEFDLITRYIENSHPERFLIDCASNTRDLNWLFFDSPCAFSQPSHYTAPAHNKDMNRYMQLLLAFFQSTSCLMIGRFMYENRGRLNVSSIGIALSVLSVRLYGSVEYLSRIQAFIKIMIMCYDMAYVEQSFDLYGLLYHGQCLQLEQILRNHEPSEYAVKLQRRKNLCAQLLQDRHELIQHARDHLLRNKVAYDVCVWIKCGRLIDADILTLSLATMIDFRVYNIEMDAHKHSMATVFDKLLCQSTSSHTIITQWIRGCSRYARNHASGYGWATGPLFEARIARYGYTL